MAKWESKRDFQHFDPENDVFGRMTDQTISEGFCPGPDKKVPPRPPIRSEVDFGTPKRIGRFKKCAGRMDETWISRGPKVRMVYAFFQYRCLFAETCRQDRPFSKMRRQDGPLCAFAKNVQAAWPDGQRTVAALTRPRLRGRPRVRFGLTLRESGYPSVSQNNHTPK